MKTVTRKSEVDEKKWGGVTINNQMIVKTATDIILDIIPEQVMLLSKDLKILYANKALLNFVNLKKNKVIGKLCYKIIHNSDTQCKPPNRCPVTEYLEGKSAKCVHTYHDKTGKKYYVEVSAYPLKEGNKILGYVHVSKDITEHKRIEKMKEKVSKDLKTMSQMKSDFINVAAHELRTPLTPIKGYTDMIRESAFGELNSEVKNKLDIIAKGISNMGVIINNIVNLSRIEAKTMKLTMGQVSIPRTIDIVVDLLREQVDEAGHKLTLDIPSDIPMIKGDEYLLRDVIKNLLSNAIKYTLSGGKIWIRAVDENNNVHITVSDTGVGIPKTEYKKIFDKFYQVSRGDTRTAKGMGLGLSIVKYIVNLHKGKIYVESEVGKGSTFHVLLPRSKK